MSAQAVNAQGAPVDLTTWLTRDQVATELGVSIETVRRIQKRGWFHPLQDADGRSRYAPEEVDAAKARYDKIAAVASLETRRLTAGSDVALDITESPPLPAAQYAEIRQLPGTEGAWVRDIFRDVFTAMERFLLTPTQRLNERHERLAQMQQEQIEKMHAIAMSHLDALGKMRGEDAERATVAKILEREEEFKIKGLDKLLEHGTKFLNRKNPGAAALTEITDQQLAERMSLEGVWTAEEIIAMGNEAKRRVEARQKAEAEKAKAS